MSFSRFLPATLLVLAALAGVSVRADDFSAQEKLKDIVARQRELFAQAEKAGDDVDRDNLQSQLQQIGNEYDLLIRHNPNFTPAYISYALLLGKLDNRREAVSLLLTANKIDSNLPVVKNQLGNFLAEEGRPVEAVNYYLSAIQLAPKEPLYHFQLGRLIAEARDDFLNTGQWTRDQLDKTMREAFLQATQCAPDDWRYAYRYGLCFYDLETPDWDTALAFWRDFEKKLKPGVEQETCRLHQAKVLVAQKKFAEARDVLATVTQAALKKEKDAVGTELAALEKPGQVK